MMTCDIVNFLITFVIRSEHLTWELNLGHFSKFLCQLWETKWSSTIDKERQIAIYGVQRKTLVAELPCVNTPDPGNLRCWFRSHRNPKTLGI